LFELPVRKPNTQTLEHRPIWEGGSLPLEDLSMHADILDP